jgi:hypothetical protein
MKPRYPEPPEQRAERLIQVASRLGAARSRARVESAGSGGEGADAIETALALRLGTTGLPAELAFPIARQTVSAATELIEAAAADRLQASDVRTEQLASLEAVISLIGRPAWLVRNRAADVAEAEFRASDEFWLIHIANIRDAIGKACSRTGAIFKEEDGERVMIGTGWMIGDGLLATNAHVARHLYVRKLIVPPGDPADGWRLRPGITGLVDFEFEQGAAGGLTHPIGRPCFIEKDEDSQPDLAILSVEPRGAQRPPAPLPQATELDRQGSWRGAMVFVIGHPAVDANDDSNVAAVFGALDGTKRISPGETLGRLGDFVLAHDCSTVNGSSGSPVLDFATGEVLGHHYWGEPGARNESVLLPAIKDHPAIAKSAAGGFGS